MVRKASTFRNSADAALAASLAKIWPHREHESSAVTGILCRLGLHFWRQLQLDDLAPGRNVRFCFWCSKVRIDDRVFDA
jgi:hypothetical protein